MSETSGTGKLANMKREAILQLLADRQRDLDRFGIRRLALFGSTARDMAGPVGKYYKLSIS